MAKQKMKPSGAALRKPRAYVVTNFTGMYPVGTCAVVTGVRDQTEARAKLLKQLNQHAGLKSVQQDPGAWRVLEIVPAVPGVHILLDGDY